MTDTEQQTDPDPEQQDPYDPASTAGVPRTPWSGWSA